MSDLSGLRQWARQLEQSTPADPGSTAGAIRLVRLRTPDEIARVLPLRRAIPLPGAGSAGFDALEKKGTRWASWEASNTRAV